jgi:hypothetical protein
MAATLSWIRQVSPINTAYLESTPSIAIDSSNNVYIAYATRGAVSGGTAFSLNTTSDIVVAKLNSSGTIQWVKQQGVGMSTNSTDTVPYIAVNSTYGIYVAYQTSSIVSGGTNLGSSDIVLFRMDVNGNMQWIRQTNVFNTSSAETSPTIALDSTGNAYVTLQTAGTLSTGTSLGNTDIGLFKYNSSGTLLWVKQLTASNTALADTIPNIALDTSNNVYITYQTTGITSGGTFLGGTGDIVVFKTDTNGNFLWVKQQPVMNTSINDVNPTIAVDNGNNVYVTYATTGVVSGGTNIGSTDIVVFKMDSNGTIRWIKQQGVGVSTTAADTLPYITVDGFENVYVSYITAGTVSGGFLLGSIDTAIFKLNNQGVLQWVIESTQFNSSGTETGPCVIKSDNNGILFLTYATTGTSSGGTQFSTGAGDIVVARLNQTAPTATVPSAPTGVTAIQTSTLSADVSWTGPTNSNNAVIRTYTVTSSPGGISTIVDGSLRTATITGLTGGGTNYTFTVVATNTSGNSVASVASTAIAVYQGPDPPTNVTGVSGNSQVTVSWTPPVVTGDSEISGYIVTSIPGFVTVNVGPSDTTAVVSGLQNGTSHIFNVRATNSFTTGLPGTSAAIVPSTVPEVPAEPTLREGDMYGSILLRWSAPGFNGGAPITNYRISCVSHPSVPSVTVGNDTYVNITGLNVNDTYTFAVSAGNINGFGSASAASLGRQPSTTLVYTEWVKQPTLLNTTSSDQNPSIVTDTQGNSYIGYICSGTISGGTLLGSSDIVVTKLDRYGNILWTIQSPNMNTTGQEGGLQLAVDVNSNVYMAYSVNGTVSGGVNSGGSDIVVSKIDSYGNIQWVKQNRSINTTQTDQNPFIAVDISGNVYVAYNTWQAASGGIYLGNSDLAVAKFNTNGDLLWVKQEAVWNTSTSGGESPGGCAVDAAGNVYVSYLVPSTIAGQVGRGGNEVVVLKLNTNGEFQWVKQDPVLNTTSSEFSTNLTVDNSGNVCLTYVAQNTISGGTVRGSYDVVVAKLDPTSALLWVKQYGLMNSAGNEDRPRIICDTANNIYVAYHIGNSVSGGLFLGGLYDIGVSKLDTDGNLLWVKTNVATNTTATDDWPTIGVDIYGGVYVSYFTQGAVSGGTFLGSNDIVIFKLSQFVLGAPAAPTSVVLSPGNSKATMSWAPLLTSYVYPITSYTLKTDTGLMTTVGGTATSATLSGLSGGGTPYTFELYATNSEGSSTSVYRSANIYALSEAPTSVVANTGNAQATISWIPPADGELPILNYTVTASPTGQSTTTINATTYRAIVSGLTNGYSYRFTVVANTSGGSSDPSAVSNAVIPSTIPAAPVNVVAVPGELYGSLVVTWQVMSNGGSPFTSYRVTASPGNISMTVSASSTRIVFNGLDATIPYTFTVVANNVNGSSPASSPSLAALPYNDLFYLDWIKELGITNTPGTDGNPACIVDASGNLFVSYIVSGTVSGGTYFGNFDAVIAKYNTYGDLLWLKQYPALNTTQNENWPFHMAIDTTGNVYLTYSTSGIVSGGTNIGSNDIVLTKLDTNGTIQWVKQQNTFNSTNNDQFPTICIDISGNIYLTYYTLGTVSGGTTNGTNSLVVVKFNASGNQVWIRQNNIISPLLQGTFEPKITVDALGNVYIIYHTVGTVSGGTFLGGSADMVVLKMDTNGTTLWIRESAIFNTTATDRWGHIATNRASSVGDIYITYTTGGTVSGGTTRGSDDIIVMKMDTNGNVVWLRQYSQMNTTGAEAYPRVVLDGSTNIYISYQVNGTVSGGTAIGGQDAAIAKLDSNGNLLWVKQQALMNTTGSEINTSIAIDPSGNIYVGYQTSGTVSGGTYLGNQDIAVFKMSQHVVSAPPIHTVTVTPGNLQAVVSWTPPPTILVNPITRYVITSDKGHSIVVNGQTFSTTITNLSGNGTSYTFTVTAENLIGTTPVTANAVLIYKLPDAPVISGVGGNTQATLGWNVPVAGDSAITSYTLSWASLTGGSGSLTIVDPTATSAIISPLTNGITYTFSIAANTAVGVGNTGSNTVTPSTVPGIPTVVAFPGRKYSELLLDITCNNGGASIINYAITASPGGRIYTVSGTTRYAPITNLDPSVAYSFTVVATNVNGPSSASTATPARNPSSDLYYLDWIKQYSAMNSSNTDQNPNCGIDASGNVYVVYASWGPVSGGTIRGNADIVVAKLNPNGSLLWLRQQFSMNTTADDQWPRMAVDPSGNVYVSYQGSGTASSGQNSGGNDIIVFKMDSNGNLLWIRQNASMNNLGNEGSTSIGVDASGNVYVSYSTSGTISSGVTAGSNDIVLIKFNGNGGTVWVRQFASLNTSSSEQIPRMVVDASGNSYIAYTSSGTISGGTNRGSGDIVVVKVDTSANVLWTRQQSVMNTTQGDNEASIAIDPAGNLYVAYYTGGTASGGVFLGGGNDTVVFKMDNNGTVLWVKQTAAMNTVVGGDLYPFISVDASGNSYVAYHTPGTASGGLLLGGNSTSDIILYKLDTDGNVLWVKQQDIMNTGNQDQRPILAAAADGTIYVTYMAFGSVSGGQNSGFWDIVVFKMSQHESAVPGAPTNLIVSGGNAQATLSWTEPANNNSLITGYTITRNPGGDVTNVAGSSTSALITGLINNVSYTFTIYATNGQGTGATATSAAVKPSGGLTVPDPPTNLFASADYGLATVTWTAPLNDGGSSITEYTVICSPAANGFRTLTVNGNTYIATVNDLLNGAVYTFTVKATNAIGTSVASAATTASYVNPIVTMAIQSASGDPTALTSYIENAVLTKTIQEVYLEIRNSIKNTQLSTVDQANVMNIVIKELMSLNNNASIFIVPNDEMPLLFSSATTTATVLLPRAAQVILPNYNPSGLASYSLVDNPVVLDGTQYLQFEIPPSYAVTVSNTTGSALLSFNGETISDGTNQYSAGDRITIGSHTYIVSAIGSITLLPLSQNKMVMMANNNGILKTQGNMSILAVSTI